MRKPIALIILCLASSCNQKPKGEVSIQKPNILLIVAQAWNEYAKVNEVHDHKGHYDSFYRKRFK